MENLRVEKRNGVAVMVWQHEEQNRFTTPFLEEVLACYDELEKDEGVSAVVVTGAQPKYFSTGIYLEWMIAEGTKSPDAIGTFLSLLNRLLLRSTSFPKPLVAAINGHAVGGGAILAACMDYRLMAADRGFIRLPEVQINIPFWPGMTAVFQDILPAKSFRDMAYTGDRFTAAQAHEMGYIDELCPQESLVPRAVELAARLGQAKTETYAAIKHGLRRRVIEIMKTEDPAAIQALIGRLKKSHGGSSTE